MSAKDLRQFAAIVFVAWAAAWGAVYWVSAGRAAKAVPGSAETPTE